jgi:oxygen-independent coproporphyrinogen-3 oxidase
MNIVLALSENKYEYEIKSLLSAFFISAQFYKENINNADLCIYIRYQAGRAILNFKNQNNEIRSEIRLLNQRHVDILSIEQKVYVIIGKIYKKTLPWGILTGVRPVKIALKMKENNAEDQEIIDYYTNVRYVNNKKASLCVRIAEKEWECMSDLQDNDRALYINIPICPSKCHYCSFVSKATKDMDFIERYVGALVKEIRILSNYFILNNIRIKTIYIGGGTPSILSSSQIYNLLKEIKDNVNLEHCREFTFEAGRADCINDEKLHAIRSGGADRICINAQSMHNTTLNAIGRYISVEDFYKAYEISTKYNFIKNVDLIYGLSGENDSMFLSSLNKVIELNPENITLHCLSYKRNSELFDEKNSHFTGTFGFESAYGLLEKNKYIPYYLYRQKYTVNNAENTGFCRPGFEGIYNRLIISERIGIVGLGAGASGKLYNRKNDHIKRVTGYKNIELYIDNIDDVVSKKMHMYDMEI